MGTGVSLYLLVMSLFVTHITHAFGWTRGAMSIAGMVAFMTGAASLPIIGRLVDRVGFRRVVLVCAAGMAAVYICIALNPGSYALQLALAVGGGLFGAGTGPVAYTRPIVDAFERKRGLALGIATAGTSVVAMIAPPVLAAVIAAYGWRVALFTLAVTGLMGLPLALSIIGRASERNARDDAGEALSESRRIEVSSATPDMTLRQALRSPRLWLLAVALMAVNVPGSGIVGQLAPMVADKGLPEAAVALVVSIYAAGLLVGRLVTGYSLDRLPAPVVAALTTFVPAIGVVFLRLPSSSFALAAAGSALVGLQQGSEVDLIAYFVSRSFGQRHYAAIYGAVAMAGALSTAFALVFFGRVHDLTGSYDAALRVGAVAFCIGAVAFASIDLCPVIARRPGYRAKSPLTAAA